jgi:hypothetical protein
MGLTHKLYIFSLVVIVAIVVAFIAYLGYSYYQLPLEERFFHPSYALLKPGGAWGHGFGIFGTLLMILGIILYMVRKRVRTLARFGLLKYWLEFHIFLCTLGPFLVLFHTSFKFGGLVAVSFWSMIAVFLSGIIGRFIYIQIPHTIEGRELSLNEVREMQSNIATTLHDSYNFDEESYNTIVASTTKKVEKYSGNLLVRSFRKFWDNRQNLRRVKAALRKNKLTRTERRKVIKLINNNISLNRKIDRLVTMQNLFKYWHVAHLPFALIMLIIMVIHVVVTIVFGYRWIF